MSITHITTLSQLNGILSKSKDKLSVIDFHASWCGPCHAIAPTFEALSKKYTNVNFLKCDVDAAKEVASQYSVTAMPTFVFLKGSTKIDQVRGADKKALESALQRHSSGAASTTAFAGQGRTLGDSSSQPTHGATGSALPAFTDLNPQVKTLLCLGGAYLLFWYLS
ncbi:hypothetical protein EW146_g2576 [Bondarzewia mesenterica]|uniref:Thioredoxin n=1 Tax=Bondarzewia mesenterica TaxID=1095465 RepID=A0A4S4M2J2_9AGAM|nr:hypothetical protein EW146_g2576 [Bondarzewia mesenterica]